MRHPLALVLCALCASSLAACKKTEAPRVEAPVVKPAALLPPAPVTEIEPNDFQRAQLIPARAVVAGNIAPLKARAADEDWYRVAAGAAGTLSLRVDLKQTGDSALDAWLEVLDRDRNRLVRVHAGGEDKGTIPAVACAESCFVKVSGTTAASYALTVLGAPPLPDVELEPNGRAVDAQALQAGRAMSGTFVSGDDEDWYKLVLPAPGPADFLRVEVAGVVGVRPELEVRALADGALLASFRAAAVGEGIFVRTLSLKLGAASPAQAAAPGADAGSAYEPPPGAAANADSGPAAAEPAKDAGGSVNAGAGAGAETGAGAEGASQGGAADAGLAAATAPGAIDAGPAAPASAGFYFVLKSSWFAGEKKGKSVRGASPLVPYALTATVEAGPPDLESEPNDDAAHATPLTGTTATGYLAPAGDSDWYRVHADAPQVLHVEVTGVERADLELAVYGPVARPGDKPPLLARANEGGPREGEILPSVGVPAGDSFVVVQVAARNLDGKWVRDGEDRQNPYKLQVTAAPDDGAIDREPNNDPATAQQVRVPVSVKGWIWPRRDLDVYRFHFDAGHAPLNVTLSAVRGVDLQLRLFELKGANAEVIGTADAVHGEGEEKLLSIPLKEGDYAVEVSSPHNKDASSSQQYVLDLQ